jgi:hypothetical protein
LIHEIIDPVIGSSIVTANTQGIFNVSGFVVGSGNLVDASLKDIAGLALGSGILSGDLLRRVGLQGYIQGSGVLDLSVPEPIFGIANVVAYMDVVHVPLPLCEAPTVSATFRWGHIFTRGDLVFSLPEEPVIVSYTLYQMQTGCVLKQIGPANRTPVKYGNGCYYVTGTAGECGQPGLWAVIWCYQKTYSDPVVEEICYFRVVDSVSCPIAGDALERYCKYGWD